MPQRDDWEKAVQGYLRQVERVLVERGAPRRPEILADLRAHLYEKLAAAGPDADLAAALAEMGSPEDYADILAAAGTSRPKRARSTPVRLLLALSLAAVSGLAALFALAPAKAMAYLWTFTGTEYVAPPFFSAQRFSELRNGMTASMVRERVGYPWSRAVHRTSSGQGSEVWWHFTLPRSREVTSYTQYAAVFDGTTNTLLRTEVVPHPQSRSEPETGQPAVADLKQLQYLSVDGRIKTISEGDPFVYVLQANNGYPTDLQGWLESHPTRVRQGWEGVPSGKVRFVYLFPACDNRMPPGTDCEPCKAIKEASPTLGIGGETVADVGFRLGFDWPLDTRESDTFLYCRGRLYSYPALERPDPGETIPMVLEDRRWLIHKLLSELQ